MGVWEVRRKLEKSMEEETKRSMEGRIMRGVVAVVLDPISSF